MTQHTIVQFYKICVGLVPFNVVIDNWKEFVGADFQEMLDKNGSRPSLLRIDTMTFTTQGRSNLDDPATFKDQEELAGLILKWSKFIDNETRKIVIETYDEFKCGITKTFYRLKQKAIHNACVNDASINDASVNDTQKFPSISRNTVRKFF